MVTEGDRIGKRDLYKQHGVKEYWINYPEAQTVHVSRLENGRFALVTPATVGQTARSKLLTGFEIPVNAIFFGD